MSDGYEVLVLVPDDDLGRILERRLEAEGHRPYRATSVDDAVDRVRERRFDRLVLDLGWPPSQGVALLERLRDVAGDPDLRAVGLVDMPVVELPAWTRKTTGLDVLQKPIPTHALIAALRSAGA